MRLLVQNTSKLINIVCFGSCLSRNTAAQFTQLYGGRILSAVYNNRSDMFNANYIKRDTEIVSEYIFNKVLKPTERQKIVYKRQAPQTIGIHFNENNANNSKYINFFDAIENYPIDLFIMDNYIDLLGKEIIINESDTKQYSIFMPMSKDSLNKNIKIGDYESVEGIIANTKEIISFIRNKHPKSQIVYLSFPVDMYQESHQVRERSNEFNLSCNFREIDLFIECHVTNKYYAIPDEPQHFKTAYYSSLAATIFNNIYIY